MVDAQGPAMANKQELPRKITLSFVGFIAFPPFATLVSLLRYYYYYYLFVFLRAKFLVTLKTVFLLLCSVCKFSCSLIILFCIYVSSMHDFYSVFFKLNRRHRPQLFGTCT